MARTLTMTIARRVRQLAMLLAMMMMVACSFPAMVGQRLDAADCIVPVVLAATNYGVDCERDGNQAGKNGAHQYVGQR